jgi:hypothetical protein
MAGSFAASRVVPQTVSRRGRMRATTALAE